MNPEKEFYIGWMEEMPPLHKDFLRRIVIGFLVLLPILAATIVLSQKPFNNHVFELGKNRQFTGIYHAQPFPMLEIDPADLSDTLSNFLLLVGYGKWGANGIMEQAETLHGSLDGKRITLEGWLIYGDGKCLLQLTQQERSILSVSPAPPVSSAVSHSGDMEEVTLQGEILDAKCYFGVMKPGEGKPHKSCAIRCISGGIAPAFHAYNEEKAGGEYYLLLGTDGKPINEALLPYVAERVRLMGKAVEWNGWKVVYADPLDIALTGASASTRENIAACTKVCTQ